MTELPEIVKLTETLAESLGKGLFVVNQTAKCGIR
jgi:hypothetical protein